MSYIFTSNDICCSLDIFDDNYKNEAESISIFTQNAHNISSEIYLRQLESKFLGWVWVTNIVNLQIVNIPFSVNIIGSICIQLI